MKHVFISDNINYATIRIPPATGGTSVEPWLRALDPISIIA